jgi:transcriptional regulator with GAF, ATPase, and Fis domain/tetratricopeptide (TPR) repeat protein/predicted Ser/Thr protein kinase
VPAPELPPRYEPVSPLGKGGGGEVWAVRDRLSGRTLALKTLGSRATEREVQALVREAVALSGLEGLGVPRVLRFGRLPDSGRPFLLRELVEGQSLLDLIEDGAEPMRCLGAIALAADQLTALHRASLLHGDVKPANIIVGDDGRATLVDLGLAAPWKERGTRAEGMTPRYAAPELLSGSKLSVRAEIFAIGATLSELLEQAGSRLPSSDRAALEKIVSRATAKDPSARFPSADELAMELRRVSKLAPRELGRFADASWPIVGIETAATALSARIDALSAGGALALEGPVGSGKTALLRRVAWSLGVAGRAVAWIELAVTANITEALDVELAGGEARDMVVLVDDSEKLEPATVAKLNDARKAGAKLVLSTVKSRLVPMATELDVFAVPPLDEQATTELLQRAIPSLSKTVIAQIMARSKGRPGRLRTIVRRLDGETIVSTADLERILEPKDGATVNSVRAEPALVRCERLLDQGRYDDAATLLAELKNEPSLAAGIARARLALGRGDPKGSLGELDAVSADAAAVKGTKIGRNWYLYRARAHLRSGEYALADEAANAALAGGAEPALEADALAVRGLAESYTGRHVAAREVLERAVALARSAGDPRVEGLTLASLGLALQRNEQLTDAKTAYEAALKASEAVGEAGAVATIRLNLGALTQGQGEFAQALAHLEAAVDMGGRAGRRSTTQQALLNLANLDLYLGRFARARASIESLGQQRATLAPVAEAQLRGLEADLAARTGDVASALGLYASCAAAYDALGRATDAAEARLESVLLAALAPGADVVVLAAQVDKAAALLADAPAHRAMMALARASIAVLRGDEGAARSAFEDALAAARAGGQKEWIWRILEARSRLLAESGQTLLARRDIEDAIGVLEEIAVRLPRDLREVYWDDARRRRLREFAGSRTSGPAASAPQAKTSGPIVPSQLQEDRLGRILAINRELAAEHDLPRLLERVTDHAISLLRAERGFVILAGMDGDLSVHTSRDRSGDDPHARFSRSIAERVIDNREPVVSQSARDDDRMAGYLSVHQLMLQSVACVPILAPGGRSIGALYVETRLRPGTQFAEELPTLTAFADQVAIAIENARLVTETSEHAAALKVVNGELERARARLEELLGHRTAQLDEVRRDLRSTRAVLRSHFGYQGLVGTSAAMRKVYALIDRIKDTDVPVLITGESGTGKEIVARAIHHAGRRSKGPFTGINCGAIPEHLLESELFGHVRGAFTGADREHRGLFREADSGTLLLDEIGEMPKKMQAGLLRVLQEKVIRPVGGEKEQSVDVRLIAATNRDLAAMVEASTFREDLYYRLHVVEVRLPPLRERLEDLPPLIDHFFKIFAARLKRDKKTISREALRKLSNHAWPGNVRQLENVLLNAWVMSDRPELLADDFDLPISGRRGAVDAPPPSPRAASRSMPPSSRPASSKKAPSSKRMSDDPGRRRDGEKERIMSALRACNWNRVKAAHMLGLPRRTFYRRLKEHGIQ